MTALIIVDAVMLDVNPSLASCHLRAPQRADAAPLTVEMHGATVILHDTACLRTFAIPDELGEGR